MAISALPSVALFAAIFMFGWRLKIFPSERVALSLGAGVSCAYVFIHMLPDLNEAGAEFVAATSHLSLPAPHLRVYFSALLGFLIFFSLENLRASFHPDAHNADGRQARLLAAVNVGGFAIYVALVGYLLVRGISGETVPVAQYSGAMALHFLGIDYTLSEEHGALYRRVGRFILAGAALAGWGLGALTEFSKPVIITLLGFVSGGVVMNSMILELPDHEEHHFGAFVLGALAYTALLAFVH
jgi:hypothetical protein